jgi:hypothetical protein
MKFMKTLRGLAITLGIALGNTASAQEFVGMAYDFVATNPAGVVAALDKYMASPTGRNNPGYPILNQYIVNGTDAATHNIVVVFPSTEAMDQANLANALSADWAVFLSEMGDASTSSGELLYQSTGVSVGSQAAVTSSNPISQWVTMEVTDPAEYVDAWLELAEEYQGDQVFSQLIAIGADGRQGATHNLVISADSMTGLFSDPVNESRGWSEFVGDIQGIRSIISRNIVMQLKSYAPAI